MVSRNALSKCWTPSRSIYITVRSHLPSVTELKLSTHQEMDMSITSGIPLERASAVGVPTHMTITQYTQATHSPLRDWGPAASHQLRTGTGDSVPSHWLGTDWGLGTQSPARGLGLGTESSADARDCCGTGHWSPGLSHLKILILTAMSLDITTEL